MELCHHQYGCRGCEKSWTSPLPPPLHTAFLARDSLKSGKETGISVDPTLARTEAQGSDQQIVLPNL
ncbi:conserved hypothetical protein [Ricinus communis]|uniref:Uncharacterized protein n=1 Tax=Ricinus communis TaxID=3988 RepID=B9RZL2_RICCO|nr:conserved hypothetical protein [Ricinus communis]